MSEIEDQITQLWFKIENDSRSRSYANRRTIDECQVAIGMIRRRFIEKSPIRRFILEPLNSLGLTSRLIIVLGDFDKCVEYFVAHGLKDADHKTLEKILVERRIMSL